VAILGYGDEARDQALRLRALGWVVTVALRSGGLSWIRAVDDGFRPLPPAEAVAHADVVVVHLPEAEQPAVWACALAPYLVPGALVVFARGSALLAGAVETDPGLDVVLVSERPFGRGGQGRLAGVAVHRDGTGRAMERAVTFARALGAAATETTTVEAEVQARLAELVARKGGLPALLAEWDRVLANPGHEPDQATLGYYERLRSMVVGSNKVPGSASSPILRSDARKAWRKRGAA
jgi:ketol-acid reductoisomerase